MDKMDNMNYNTDEKYNLNDETIKNYKTSIDNIKVNDEMKNDLKEKIRLQSTKSDSSTKSKTEKIHEETNKLKMYSFFTTMVAACILLLVVFNYSSRNGFFIARNNLDDNNTNTTEIAIKDRKSKEDKEIKESVSGKKREYKEEVKLDGLTTFKDEEELKEFLKQNAVSEVDGLMKAATNGIDEVEMSVEPDAADTGSTQAASKESSTRNMSSSDFSKTNVQVDEVDEADIIKTNGKYIFALVFDGKNYNYKVVSVDVDKQEKVSEIEYDIPREKGNFSASDMFLYDDKLIVIAKYDRQRYYINSFIYSEDTADSEEADGASRSTEKKIEEADERPDMTVALVYTIDGEGKLKETRKVEISGSYVSSRMVGGVVYLVANQYNYSFVYNGLRKTFLPAYYDTTQNENESSSDFIDFEELEYKPANEIYYYKDSGNYSNYTNIGAFDLNDNKKVNIKTILGTTDRNIYVSENNIYLYRTVYPRGYWDPYNGDNDVKTEIYKIGIFGTELNFIAKGEVEGTLLNQFSMDEYNGNFRIATTQDKYRFDEWYYENNLYILDEDLNTIGKIEGFAKGERIYSVRFMGKRGFVVTFKQIDPLITLDLSDPKDPRIMGELKIPGVSNYLQLYDDNHIIGIGEDIMPVGDTLRKKALKISYFDISDMENPVEVNNVVFGNESSYSEAESNHKAVLLSREKGILAIPVNMYYGRYPDDELFNGIKVFNVDAEKGVSEKGDIGSTNDYGTRRVIYIGNNYYVLSDSSVKVVDMESLNEVADINLK